jgi:hypothetical protein
MSHDNPIADHREFDRCAVKSGIYFPRLRGNGSHAGMRHVPFDGDASAADWFSGSVCQPESDRRLADARWLWRNFVRDVEVR